MNEYRTVAMMEPEELDDDSRGQYVAALLLEEFNRRGWVEGCPRLLLNNAEREMAKKIMAHPDGIGQFSDEFIEMCLAYWVAGLKSLGYDCKIDMARSIKAFKGV